ncbi:MAG: hypothetical protein PHS15_06790 [Clostridiaceae bacterium]|nr:hypothetical protein [Clostridiaceae bacterium]
MKRQRIKERTFCISCQGRSTVGIGLPLGIIGVEIPEVKKKGENRATVAR